MDQLHTVTIDGQILKIGMRIRSGYQRLECPRCGCPAYHEVVYGNSVVRCCEAMTCVIYATRCARLFHEIWEEINRRLHARSVA